MKNTLLLLFLFGVVLLAACSAPAAGPSAPADASPTPFAAAFLTQDYSDAASLRNQLAYGTLKLEGSENTVTAEQAKTLLPFWQALKTLAGSSTASDEEITALQNQIVEALTPQQLQAIAGMQITNAHLNAYYAEFGIVMPTPMPGVTKVPGSGSSISQEDKEATRTAAQALGTPVASGAGQAAKTLLYDQVIELLTRISGG